MAYPALLSFNEFPGANPHDRHRQGHGPSRKLRRAGIFPLSLLVLICGAPFLSAGNGQNVAASVKAEKGPVQLRLEVLRTKVRPGDPILVRLTLKNIGHKGFVVTDDIFSPNADFVGVMSTARGHGAGIVITLQDPSGGAVFWDEPFSDGFCTEPGKESTPWSQKIASSSSEVTPNDSIAPTKYFSKKLKPGESVQTGPWIQVGSCPRAMTKEEFALGFAQLHAKLSKPGRYSVRAVYDYTIEKKFNLRGHSFPEGVKITTPNIFLEVAPR